MWMFIILKIKTILTLVKEHIKYVRSLPQEDRLVTMY